VNGATGALSIGPSAGYTLFFVFMHVSLLFTAYASSYTHMHIHVITYIALIIWIKLKLKMPNFLTKYACLMSYIEKKEVKGKNLSDVSSSVQKEGRGKFGHRRAAIGHLR
jgi:hypothetical protein